AFKQLFYDHRRIVELLLKKIKIQFSTSCVFTKLENYRGKDLRKILELYFSEEDVENKIDLYCEYRHGESPESLIEAFPVFFAIFDSVYHYSKPRKDFDKIIDYYLKLR
ncbi:MAG: hypothetical protein QG657_5319, partial [Acidobacteriota bacterium]|nr:hypothetical protein [Acidobacteriota bacterium]